MQSKASQQVELVVLKTVAEVIKALGGTAAVAATYKRTPQAISNWRSDGRIAREFFFAMSAELERRGFSASPALWGMATPQVAA